MPLPTVARQCRPEQCRRDSHATEADLRADLLHFIDKHELAGDAAQELCTLWTASVSKAGSVNAPHQPIARSRPKRIPASKSWDSVMAPVIDSEPICIPQGRTLDEVAEEAGVLLAATYGGASG